MKLALPGVLSWVQALESCAQWRSWTMQMTCISCPFVSITHITWGQLQFVEVLSSDNLLRWKWGLHNRNEFLAKAWTFPCSIHILYERVGCEMNTEMHGSCPYQGVSTQHRECIYDLQLPARSIFAGKWCGTTVKYSCQRILRESSIKIYCQQGPSNTKCCLCPQPKLWLWL